MWIEFYLKERTFDEIFAKSKELIEAMKPRYNVQFTIQKMIFYLEHVLVTVNLEEAAAIKKMPRNMLAKQRNYFDRVGKVTNQNYKKGRSFEYRCMAKLRKRGWDCIRSFGSWGPADIRAFRDGVMLYVQAKWSVHGETRPEHYALDDVVDLAANFGGIPIFAGIMNRRIYFVNLLTGEEYAFD